MKKASLFLIPALLGLLSSCQSGTGEYSFAPLNEDVFSKKQYDGYYLQGDWSELQSKDEKRNATFRNIYNSSAHVAMPSLGEQVYLIIPIDFAEYPGKQEQIKEIKTAFLGGSANSFFSVKEFFDKSSHSRLHLNPHICETFYRCPYTYASLANQSSPNANKNTLTAIYKAALSWYEENFPEDFASIQEQTAGQIPTYFVYNAPYAGYLDGSTHRDSMFWAFTINHPSPVSWSSYYMMHQSSGEVDSHTFIHETGHLFGLKDYYDYSSSTIDSELSPTGRMDIMDCSLGDENAFSKMLLDWTRPYVPEESCEITLRPFEGNGDCILLSRNYNGTPYGEYVLLQYYTPTYLNRIDARLRDDPSMRLFQKAGVIAYKIDSRLGVFETAISSGYFSRSVSTKGKRLDIVHDNSSHTKPLIQLLDKSSDSFALSSYYVASDHQQDLENNGKTLHLRDSLFYEGDGFKEGKFEDWVLSDGTFFDIKFTVKEIASTYASIQIEM